MKNHTNQRMRKLDNKKKPIYSTGQKALFLAEYSKQESFKKPPLNYSKMHEETLRAVIAELSISSNLKNINLH